MMELTTTKENIPAPIEITEDIQVSLNRLGRELETHTESGIRIGKELIVLKEITPHGKFGELVEWAYGLTERTCRNYVQVAEKFGDSIGRQRPFSNQVLIELSRPSVPESAREEAAEHEALTVKQAKEIAASHKRIADLQKLLDEKKAPSLTDLIPGLTALLNKEAITKRMALTYSQLSKEDQETALYSEQSKIILLDQLTRLESEKLTLAESEIKARAKAETMQVQFDDAVGRSTQEILAAKDKEIELAKKEVTQAKVDIRAQIETSIRAAVDLEYQDEIIKAREDKEKAEKAKKTAQDKAGAAYDEQSKLISEVKMLKDKLGVDNPTNLDIALEKQVQSAANSVLFLIRQIKNDMATSGGSMERSIGALEVFSEEIFHKLAELREDSESIINV